MWFLRNKHFNDSEISTSRKFVFLGVLKCIRLKISIFRSWTMIHGDYETRKYDRFACVFLINLLSFLIDIAGSLPAIVSKKWNTSILDDQNFCAILDHLKCNGYLTIQFRECLRCAKMELNCANDGISEHYLDYTLSK